jgi:hypothetical protein
MNENPDMLPIYHKPTEDEPGMILDAEQNIIEFSGRSLPEDPGTLYEPVLDWVKEYSENPNPATVVDFKLDYFNSSTARFIVEILEIFEDIRHAGHQVSVNWWFFEDDSVMQERGEEIESIIDLDFNYKMLTR